jgi:hypothetical protein
MLGRTVPIACPGLADVYAMVRLARAGRRTLKLSYRCRPCSRASLKIALLGRPDLVGSTAPRCRGGGANQRPCPACDAWRKNAAAMIGVLGLRYGTPSMLGRRSVG